MERHELRLIRFIICVNFHKPEGIVRPLTGSVVSLADLFSWVSVHELYIFVLF